MKLKTIKIQEQTIEDEPIELTIRFMPVNKITNRSIMRISGDGISFGYRDFIFTPEGKLVNTGTYLPKN